MSRIHSVRPPGWRRPLATGVATAALLIPFAVAGENHLHATKPTTATSPAAASHRITLITGDAVTFTEGQQPIVQAEQSADRPERGHVAFLTQDEGRDFYVIPSDAEPYVRADVLDRELFNVRALVRQRLTDAHTSTFPVMVTYGKDARVARKTATGLPATHGKDRPLASVNGFAVDVERTKSADFWAALDTPQGKTLDQQVKKVWLDQRLEPALDHSVAQIGAPEAWKSGYDGKGVTVAVLDTGIDADHPDLKDRIVASRSFLEGAPDTADTHGHGTHVASTIAGSGAASGGRFKGVAPGAQLAIGKVCDAAGCPESAILDGMDWAAKSGARVVNMSLGGGATDGGDLLSQRVNELTQETGTLFVIAAGNNGQDLSVGSPGTADAALTVGAVDKNDKQAPFASRGPRLGDAAVKPEITAPGVAINAARAKGTLPEYPGDGEQYVRISGTSMATPHVAGAAALLAQAHPELKAAALKNTLASTGKDVGEEWYSQGAGRLDVPAALKPVAAPASVNVGRLAYDADPATREVTYTNTGDRPITLKLALTQHGWDGRDSKAAALSADEVIVPAHSEASVKLTVDPAGTDAGVYGGTLMATGDGAALRTPVSWYHAHEPIPTHRLTVKLIDREGKPVADQAPYIFPEMDQADTPANDPFQHPGGRIEVRQTEPGTWTGEAPEGSYVMAALDHRNRPELLRTTLLSASGMRLDRDREIVLDGRNAVRIKATTPKPTYNYNQVVSVSLGGIHGTLLGFSNRRSQSAELWATPTAAPAKGHLTLQEAYTLGERTALATARLGGREVDLKPEYEPLQTGRLPGRRQLPVVYAGAGTADDFKALDVKGKAVLAKIAMPAEDGSLPWSYVVSRAADEAAKRAKEAGALVILPYLDKPDARPIQPLTAGPKATPFPLLGISQSDGERLRQQPHSKLDLDIKTNPAYMYNLHYAPKLTDGIPAGLTHRVDPARMKKTRTSYHSEVPGLVGYAVAFALERDRAATYTPAPAYFHAPARIDQYYGGITGTQSWLRQAALTDGANRYVQLDTEPWRGATESFFSGPMTMVAPDAGTKIGAYRRKGTSGTDHLVASPHLGDSAAGHFITVDFGPVYPFTYKLFREGKEIPGQPVPGVNTPYFDIPSDEATYRMEGTFTLPSSGYFGPNEKVKRYASKVENIWTFRSKVPTAQECGADEAPTCSVPPLLQLRYDLDLNLDNQARAGKKHRIGITAAPASHSTEGGTVESLSLSYSLDAGRTWLNAEVKGSGTRFTAELNHTATKDAEVWLKAEAKDTKGNTVTQTVQKAYTLR